MELLDLYPALAHLCRLPAPAGLEGRGLAPLLARPRAAWSHPAFTKVLHDGVMGKSVRTERWRYNEWDAGRRGMELYDEARDPGELINLAHDAKHAGTVAQLRRVLATMNKP